MSVENPQSILLSSCNHSFRSAVSMFLLSPKLLRIFTHIFELLQWRKAIRSFLFQLFVHDIHGQLKFKWSGNQGLLLFYTFSSSSFGVWHCCCYWPSEHQDTFRWDTFIGFPKTIQLSGPSLQISHLEQGTLASLSHLWKLSCARPELCPLLHLQRFWMHFGRLLAFVPSLSILSSFRTVIFCFPSVVLHRSQVNRPWSRFSMPLTQWFITKPRSLRIQHQVDLYSSVMVTVTVLIIGEKFYFSCFIPVLTQPNQSINNINNMVSTF